MYDIKSKFIKNSPLPCWKGYKRKPGTTEFSKGSCVKDSPATKKQKGGGTRKRNELSRVIQHSLVIGFD